MSYIWIRYIYVLTWLFIDWLWLEWLYVYLIIMLKELHVTRQEETTATEISKKYQS